MAINGLRYDWKWPRIVKPGGICMVIIANNFLTVLMLKHLPQSTSTLVFIALGCLNEEIVIQVEITSVSVCLYLFDI